MDDCPIFWLIDNNMDTEWGYCVPAEGLVAKRYKWEIGVAGEFPTRRKYLGTLVHELFHLYQMTILGLLVPNHGKRFTAYMNTTAKRELDKMLRKERKSNGT